MKRYNFDEINNRYNTGSYKYDRILEQYPFANENSIIMTLADMDFKTAPELIDYMKSICDKGIFGYMTEFYHPYQDSIISWYQNHHQLMINPEEIIFSNGTIEAIKAIVNMFTNPDDYVALSRPIYGHFTYSIENECHRRVKNIPLIKENGHYHFDFQKLHEELSRENVKIYILCSPHNPVGRVWTYDELQTIINICHQTNTLLICDEVHCDLIRKSYKHHPILSIGEDHKNIIMISSPGKTFNISGLQISNMIVKDETLRLKIRNEFDRDISTFAQAGLIGAYTYGDNWVKELNDYLDKTIDEALLYIEKHMPYCKVFKPEGTYFLWLDFNGTNLSNEKINEVIYQKANVILQDGYHCDPENGAGFQRMPIAMPRAKVLEALERIKKAFEEVGVQYE